MNQNWRLFTIQCGLILMLLIGPAPARADSPFDSPKWQALAQQQILDATKQFYVALNGVLSGDLDLISAVWSHREDVTNLSSSGGRDNGWNEIFQRYQAMVRMQLGGKIAPQDIVVVADGEMGFSTCTESGETRSAAGAMQSYTKRATNVFRLEDGKWKLIHHHTDPVQILEP